MKLYLVWDDAAVESGYSNLHALSPQRCLKKGFSNILINFQAVTLEWNEEALV